MSSPATYLTHRLDVYSLALETLVNNNADTLGIKAVYYGDQDRIPVTPTVCIEPGQKAQSYKGGGVNRMLAINLTTYLFVYSSLVASGQLNRLTADGLSEDLEDIVNADRTLSLGLPREQGIVIEMHVSDIQSGYATKANSIVRATRITVEALSQNLLPS